MGRRAFTCRRHTDVTLSAAVERTLWSCPRCDDLKPTRHESVVRHIDREHDSLEEQLSVIIGETRASKLK
ncbi:MAG TPA: hypothetical protein VE572_04465 [Nitrososphaeraceae archaeon]|nr:hypothetical protein [Nitrososphaeraceae archaeon]